MRALRDGYVHTAQVVQEADLSVLVAPHQTNEDDIAFLSLEPVYGVYAQQVAIGFEKGIPAEQGAQQLHLAFVRGYDTGVDAFRQYPFLAYLLEIGFQDVQGEPCLLGIGAAGAVRIAGFSEVGYLNRRESWCTHCAGRFFRQVWGGLFLVCRVYPFHWRVPVQNAPVFQLPGHFPPFRRKSIRWRSA